LFEARHLSAAFYQIGTADNVLEKPGAVKPARRRRHAATDPCMARNPL
jgi:hypothetical protein